MSWYQLVLVQCRTSPRTFTMGNEQSDCDCDCDYDRGMEGGRGSQRRETVDRSAQNRKEFAPNSDLERVRRYDEVDPDEYALVPAKPKARAYEERKAIVSPQDLYDREMNQLKMEEQKIKNKIASERLSFDVQKRQQSKELHDIKVAILKKYPSMMFNKQASE